MDPVRHLGFSLIIRVAVIALGTLGYLFSEGWSTFVLISFGAGIIANAVGSMIQFMGEGQLRQVLGREELEKPIEKLQGHYSFCNCGRIRTLVCREFQTNHLPAVAAENDAQLCERLSNKGFLFVRGHAPDIGASRIAPAIPRPAAVDVIEIATAGQNLEKIAAGPAYG